MILSQIGDIDIDHVPAVPAAIANEVPAVVDVDDAVVIVVDRAHRAVHGVAADSIHAVVEVIDGNDDDDAPIFIATPSAAAAAAAVPDVAVASAVPVAPSKNQTDEDMAHGTW